SQTALATGEDDILIGGDEYVTAVLQADNPDLDWVLPDQGGIRWKQAIGVFADSARPEAALDFDQYGLTAEGQAGLATSPCYWGMPDSSQATMTDEQKAILRWDEQDTFIANAHAFPSPTEEMERSMQDVWIEFLAR